MSYLKASEQNTVDEANINSSLCVPLQRNKEALNGQIVMRQCKRSVLIIPW